MASFFSCGHAGIRTQGPILKRDVLYRLSYVTSGICFVLKELSDIPAFNIRVPSERGGKGRLFFFQKQGKYVTEERIPKKE